MNPGPERPVHSHHGIQTRATPSRLTSRPLCVSALGNKHVPDAVISGLGMISGRLAIHEQFRHGSNLGSIGLGSIFLEGTPATSKRSRILQRGNEKLRGTKLRQDYKIASDSQKAARILPSKQSTLGAPVHESEGLAVLAGGEGLVESVEDSAFRPQASFLRKRVAIPSKLTPSKSSVTPPSGTLV